MLNDQYFCKECNEGYFWVFANEENNVLAGCTGVCSTLDDHALDCDNYGVITKCEKGYIPSGNGDHCMRPIEKCLFATPNI